MRLDVSDKIFTVISPYSLVAHGLIPTHSCFSVMIYSFGKDLL
jgi:hypothetical protein